MVLKTLRITAAFFAVFLLLSCRSSYLAQWWKAPNTIPRTYSKIMVVGVVKTSDTALRRKMEIHLVTQLNELGYNAVAALDEYGPKGLSNLAQEDTYLKLCERGIDAVMTVALLDNSKGRHDTHSGKKYLSDGYYYNHIWNYRNLQGDLTDTSKNAQTAKPFFLESILFDLQALQPLYVVETKPFNATTFYAMEQEYGKMVVKNMLRHKIIRRQPKRATPVKAF
jgi:hypothetical protein